MERIHIELSKSAQGHLDILTDELLKEKRPDLTGKELRWCIREAFIEGIIWCADKTIQTYGSDMR